MNGREPLLQRNMRIFKDGSDSDRELLVTGAASIQARSLGLAIQGIYLLAITTVRADRAIRPTLRFKIPATGFVVSELLEKRNQSASEFSLVIYHGKLLHLLIR